MHLAVLCLRRKREDQKLILSACGRCLYESLWYGGSNMKYGVAESWHFYPAGHDQVDPTLYMHLYRIRNMQRRNPGRCYPIQYTNDLLSGAVFCNQLHEQSYSYVPTTFASQLCKDNAAVLSKWLTLYRFGSGGSANNH